MRWLSMTPAGPTGSPHSRGSRHNSCCLRWCTPLVYCASPLIGMHHRSRAFRGVEQPAARRATGPLPVTASAAVHATRTAASPAGDARPASRRVLVESKPRSCTRGLLRRAASPAAGQAWPAFALRHQWGRWTRRGGVNAKL